MGEGGTAASTPRSRLLGAALDLYAQFGVDGTSLQMIADRLGVTKAAVYHQFHSKDEILIAVLEPLLQDLRALADHAQQQKTRSAQLEATLAGVVDLAVRHRQLSALLEADPAVQALAGLPQEIRSLNERIGLLLLGPDPDPAMVITSAMLGSALMMTGKNPKLAAVADDELRVHMLTTARRMLALRSRR
jgi:AcrR family transcriptional regulator